MFIVIGDTGNDFIYGSIAIFALLEVWSPRRALKYSVLVRWSSNFSLGFINIFVNFALFTVLGIGAAATVGQNDWGLLNLVSWPSAVEIPLTILVLDCAFYWEHRLLHAVPVMWRAHLVHHSDLDIDFSTAVRHHPFEVFISVGFIIPIVAALGAPPLGVLMFLIWRAIFANFTHANFALGDPLDRAMRLLIVTPDMHRIHHSAIQSETDSNFGDLFPFWDRLFGTYHAQPANGHAGMRIGLDYLDNPRQLWLDRLLGQPFTNPP